MDYFVQSIKKEETREWLLYKHYAHRIPPISYAFGLYTQDKQLVGVCTFGSGGNFNNNTLASYPLIELNRLVVNDDTYKNSSSFFVASCLKQLPSHYIVLSYADSGQGHIGYIYQATNWIYTGLGQPDYEFQRHGKQYHRKQIFEALGSGSLGNAKKHGFQVVTVAPKHRYFFPLGSKRERKHKRQAIHDKYGILPYPKGTTQRYDASFQPTIQGLLL